MRAKQPAAEPRVPRRLSGASLRYARSVEAYLRATGRPRWMERVMEVDGGIARERRRIERHHRELRCRTAGDAAAFAARWRAFADSYAFDPALNELIRAHNEWYPIERDLPMNPRTGEYVTFGGRSHERPQLDREWLLREFPADGPAQAGEPPA